MTIATDEQLTDLDEIFLNCIVRFGGLTFQHLMNEYGSCDDEDATWMIRLINALSELQSLLDLE